MAELENLRARVEKVNHELKSAHSARERESEALMALWQHIRTRFTDQDQELARLRRRTVELEDAKDELSGMVRALLEAVEATTEEINDPAVPRISKMAEDLLATNSENPAGPESGAAAVADRPAEPMPAPAAASVSPSDAARREVADADTATVGESLSPGIRKLISRVEGVFDDTRQGDHAEPKQKAGIFGDADSDDDLERDMREIEKLRTELQGLRTRINTSGD
jgi:predicted RNase H-like nuclease (RuvC/YqgF family)